MGKKGTLVPKQLTDKGGALALHQNSLLDSPPKSSPPNTAPPPPPDTQSIRNKRRLGLESLVNLVNNVPHFLNVPHFP
jgi:hypothetical protein